GAAAGAAGALPPPGADRRARPGARGGLHRDHPARGHGGAPRGRPRRDGGAGGRGPPGPGGGGAGGGEAHPPRGRGGRGRARWVGAAALLVAASALVRADKPSQELTPEQRKELEAKAAALNEEGEKLYEAGKWPDATKRLEAALELRRTLYPRAKYPDGHPVL